LSQTEIGYLKHNGTSMTNHNGTFFCRIDYLFSTGTQCKEFSIFIFLWLHYNYMYIASIFTRQWTHEIASYGSLSKILLNPTKNVMVEKWLNG